MRFLFRAVVGFILVIAGSGLLSTQQASGTSNQKSPGSKSFATIDGIPITETQARMEGAAALDQLELRVLKEKAADDRDEHEILEKALEHLIEERLLRAEAEKRGISKEELLAQEVQQKVPEPTGEEIDAFYKENQQRIRRPKEEVAPEISKYLKRRAESELRKAFVDRLEKEHHVIRSFEPLRYDVNVADRPTLGPASAPVLLVLFSDFQCPYCKQLSGTLKEVLKNYGNKVHLVFRQFPLTQIHANAERAAMASLCAEAQGHFWQMHDLLFEDQNKLSDADLKSRAGKLALDVGEFNACLDSARYANQIREDLHAGAAAGVEGTPALFINGRFLYGSHPYKEVAAIIDEELKKKN